jgi:hypothetical protein
MQASNRFQNLLNGDRQSLTNNIKEPAMGTPKKVVILKIWHYTQNISALFVLIYPYLYITTFGQFQSRDTVLREKLVFSSLQLYFVFELRQQIHHSSILLSMHLCSMGHSLKLHLHQPERETICTFTVNIKKTLSQLRMVFCMLKFGGFLCPANKRFLGHYHKM